MLSKNEFSSLLESKFGAESSSISPQENLRTAIIYPPELEDLYRLYAFVIDNCVTSVLEFGAGWSTFALALGVNYNKMRFAQEYPNYNRNPHPFSICSVDNSKVFMSRALGRLDLEVRNLVTPHYAVPRMKKVDIYSVTEWHPIPRFDYDLIYIDAPEPEQVESSDQHIEMKCIHDLPISGDLLINEPYVLPQTSVIIDGRTSNARFLISHLYRAWKFNTNFEGDSTSMLLDEPPLGKINKNHIDFRLNRAIGPTLGFFRS